MCHQLTQPVGSCWRTRVRCASVVKYSQTAELQRSLCLDEQCLLTFDTVRKLRRGSSEQRSCGLLLLLLSVSQPLATVSNRYHSQPLKTAKSHVCKQTNAPPSVYTVQKVPEMRFVIAPYYSLALAYSVFGSPAEDLALSAELLQVSYLC
jgi:hypothetical protein